MGNLLLSCFLLTPIIIPQENPENKRTEDISYPYHLFVTPPPINESLKSFQFLSYQSPLPIPPPDESSISASHISNQIAISVSTPLVVDVSDPPRPTEPEKNREIPLTSVRTPTTPLPEASQVTLFLEALYWQVIQDNLLASIKANGIQSGSISSLKWIHPHFDYAPGFRMAVGALLPYDQWKISLTYTFLKTSVSQHSQNQQPEFYMLLSGHMQSLAEEVKQLWEMNFQTINCMLGREFFLSHTLSLQPQMGIKGAYPRQNWHVSYIHPVFSPGEQIFQKQKISNFFWGIGPNLGMDLVWHLPKKWAISMQPSWSLLCSRIYSRVDYKDPANPSEDIDPGTIVHGAQNTSVVIPQIEMWLGIEWSHFYPKERSIQLRLGYDVQYFWNEANILAFVQLPQGNLMLHGGTFGLLFGF